jgi:hypothetical protein
MVRYSDINEIDQAVTGLLCSMDPHGPLACPWSEPRVKRGTMSIADVIEKIRLRYGESAARSVRITVH